MSLPNSINCDTHNKCVPCPFGLNIDFSTFFTPIKIAFCESLCAFFLGKLNPYRRSAFAPVKRRNGNPFLIGAFPKRLTCL